jgi:oligopeptide transport system permease protein
MSAGPFVARRGWRANRLAMASLGVIAGLTLLALVGPALSPHRFDALDYEAIAAPPGASHAHWLGTDRLGRDLYVRTLDGTRISLAIGVFATLISVAVGVCYGAIAGFSGGRVDHLMMRLLEILSGLPLMFLVILFHVAFGGGTVQLFVSIGAVGWLTTARIVRGETLSLRRREFIEAALAGGATAGRVLRRHVIPNVIGSVIVYATLTVPQMILFESFLSFLGLGIQEPHASLGTLVADGAREMEVAPWILLVPGTLLVLLLLAFNLFGDGLRDALGAPER